MIKILPILLLLLCLTICGCEGGAERGGRGRTVATSTPGTAHLPAAGKESPKRAGERLRARPASARTGGTGTRTAQPAASETEGTDASTARPDRSPPGKNHEARRAELQSDSTSPHLFLGNPSLASLSAPDNYLIEKPQYALSYNNSLRIANWASWQLNAGWLGDEPRGKFAPDLTLPDTFVRVLPSDYREYSGIFDRGHLCPSGDRRRSREDNDATFLMSNIIPQACGNNQGPWEKLESYARRLAGQGRDLYIIAGGAGTKERIGEKRINVPQHTWKVMVVLPETGLSPEDVTVDTRAIAVVMPNVSDIRDDAWMSFVRTIEDVEKMTGYDFLRRIPEPARSALRKKRNAEGEAYE